MKTVKIYTDGSYKPKYNLASYGFIVIDSEKKIHESVFVEDPSKDKKKLNKYTCNVMEMKAVIKALNFVRSNNIANKSTYVYLYTDSQYVQLGWEEWIYNWKNNGWLTSNKRKVKNKDLWVTLDNLLKSIENEFGSVYINWIESHEGNKYNEIVDEMCTQAIIDYMNNNNLKF